MKGIMMEATDWFVGSDVCGWGENVVDYFDWYPGPGYNPTNLIIKPFFLKSYPDLFSTNSATTQAYAANNRKALLAKAIPARTFAVGRNEVDDSIIQYNVDMNNYRVNFWPSSRDENSGWQHSDVKNVGYLYTRDVYDYIVENGGLE